MRVGFIGLGNMGGKLSASLLRNGHSLVVRDLDQEAARPLLEAGAEWSDSPGDLAERNELVITCLPSPAAVREVMEGPRGAAAALGEGRIWLEMSTTDAGEVRRLGRAVRAAGGRPLDGPVSGGCHRAATGNISIFVGGDRPDFERAFPALSAMGRNILHVGELGSASVLKVVTNYLASVHLVALGEALMTAKRAGADLNIAYEAIRISSGNSFVHETESQVILNGSYDINFTMDLVVKDMSLFCALAEEHGVPAEVAPLALDIFRRGMERYGPRAWSPGIVRLLEEECATDLRAPGFPSQIRDAAPERPGREVRPSRAGAGT